MGLPESVHAIRHAVAVSRLDHLCYVRVRGDGAYDALNRVCPADLYVRDGQMLHGLLLREDATVLADVYLGCDDDEYLLLAEGPTATELVDHLRQHAADIDDVAIEDMSDTYGMIGLDGPYAWELMGRVAGEETIGLPYLNFFYQDRWICCRAGKTGEYGYVVIVPVDEVPELYGRCLELGAALDAVPVHLEALDQCALENWFFNIRREGREPVTPIELQLQWRVSYRKPYVGSHALAERRAHGPQQRLTCLIGSHAIAIDAEVALDGKVIGRIVNAGHSHVRGDWVALALIDVEWAHSGIDSLTAHGVGGEGPVRTVSPPVINNRSLYLSPQLHSYATRAEFGFPALVRG